MFLRYCSITGADDAIEPGHLAELSEPFPHAEWAILYSPKLEGTPRYPTREWRRAFIARMGHHNTAIHLCGDAVRQFAEGELDELVAPFGRMQLNFSAARYKGDIAKLAAHAAEVTPVTIVQMHGGNGDVYKEFARFGHIEVLYDASGGRGAEPAAWLPPLEVPTGYAGGLRPDNIAGQLQAISLVAGDTAVWCDMETGVRNAEDRFLVDSARKVLELTAPYAGK
jgi:hypothetical protein